MNDRFSRCAAWLFGIAIPVALAVVVLAPIPFMRGLGAVALVCAMSGFAINALAVRAARCRAYWPVGETMAQAGFAPAVAVPAVAAPAMAARAQATAARLRRPGREPRLALARMADIPRWLVLFPGRLPARMTYHA